jgi:hypothetical protein
MFIFILIIFIGVSGCVNLNSNELKTEHMEMDFDSFYPVPVYSLETISTDYNPMWSIDNVVSCGFPNLPDRMLVPILYDEDYEKVSALDNEIQRRMNEEGITVFELLEMTNELNNYFLRNRSIMVIEGELLDKFLDTAGDTPAWCICEPRR